MIATRLRQISLLVFAMAVSALGLVQMFQRTTGEFPQQYIIMLAVVVALFLVLWALTIRFQPYASQSIIPCVLLLTGTGVTMIARIDQSMGKAVAMRQLLWLCLALVIVAPIIIFLRDYRVLRRFSYVSMVVGLVLLLSPMLPVLGEEVNGARIWVKIPGLGQFQPGEFAKLFLAFFFAAYLFDHRDQLAVGGKKVLGLQLPRIKDLGPIIIVWFASMGVLIMQHDLGTSLMFFAMFVAMLYVATGRKSWIVIGLIAFAAGAVLAAGMFSHVGQRVDAWLHPFSAEEYNKEYGGSWQLVTGIFGLASGGLLGTGLGQGHPALTTFANSDFIYAALGEELGLVGLLAILMMYLIIVASGFITSMKVKDGFGKLLASGLVFTMAFQVFTVVGGITLVIPLTGLTLPYMAAGGSSLIANYVLAALLIVISNAANAPEPELTSDTFQYEALAVLRDKELKARARATEEIVKPRSASAAASAASADATGTEAVAQQVAYAAQSTPTVSAAAAQPGQPTQSGQSAQLVGPGAGTPDQAPAPTASFADIPAPPAPHAGHAAHATHGAHAAHAVEDNPFSGFPGFGSPDGTDNLDDDDPIIDITRQDPSRFDIPEPSTRTASLPPIPPVNGGDRV
ncbi:FtsW/RodA/SpoVE family cell cycle protein [Bifidobacterium callitrichidarum]|uniref:Cell division protein FtsW n=1 Tax=Bifidobacterium callitrichidarum TaxID=2052941 RepID=A0A2U2ND53_9BIFI|nr:FtsW/RodA/SpoVE family cell cycle protein [Bifidobacterium callitrichidarum]PWG67017.1 cell division protein FtsW [Bifidobacterium callitrichidarum]